MFHTRKVHNRQNQEVPHAHNRGNERTTHHKQGNPHGEKHHDAHARRNAPAPQAECRAFALNPPVHNVREQNQHPHGERTHHNQEDHGEECFLRAEQRQQNSDNNTAGGNPYGTRRHPGGVHRCQCARRHTVGRQRVHQAGTGIQVSICRGQCRNKHHKVHEMRRARNAQLIENQNKRGGFDLLAQLTRRTPRNNRHHNKQRQHIERCQTNHHSLRTGTHRSGRILGFCGGDRNHLNTAE